MDEEVSRVPSLPLPRSSSISALFFELLADFSPFSFLNSRLKGCEQDVEIWQRVLSVRSLVLTPTQDKEMWIKFANLCRKQDRLGLAEKTLNSLLGPQEMGTAEGVSSANPTSNELLSSSRRLLVADVASLLSIHRLCKHPLTSSTPTSSTPGLKDRRRIPSPGFVRSRSSSRPTSD